MTTTPTEQPRWTEYRPLDEVARAARNPKRHDEENLAASLARFGYVEQITVDERTGKLVAGHGRLDALLARRERGEDPPDGITVDDAGVWAVPVARGWRSTTDAEAEAYLIESNQSVMLPGWDPAGLAEMLDDIGRTDPSLLLPAGFGPEVLARFLDGLPDGAGGGGGPRPQTPSLADRFGVPPFDVIDARTGWWRERKTAWLSLGIRSEIGRSASKPGGGEAGQGKDAYLTAQGNTGPDAVNGKKKRRETRPDAHILRSDSGRDSDYYRRKQDVEARLGRTLSTEEFQEHYYAAPEAGNGGISDSGTSVFDPVLCELVYRWFTPADGTVLDPFAGGSVRGIVAGVLGRTYLGVDLSAEQVLANEVQAETILPAGRPRPTYLVGDARRALGGVPDESADALLTCPPYLWLERYSDDERDLSTMTRDGFTEAYRAVLTEAYRILRPDSFAVLVVGCVRDSNGRQHDLRALTVDVAEQAGFTLRNVAVLITPVGSLAVRAPRQFGATRVLGRGYQDVVVLVKGSANRAAERCGHVSTEDLLAAVTASTGQQAEE